jgi:hypothetical protein
MKTIEDCIKTNKEFLPTLKKLVSEAIEGGEDLNCKVLIFVNDKSNITKIVSGTGIALWGSIEGLINSYGYSLHDLIKLSD